MAATPISAADAVKAFKTRPLVQTAKHGKIPYKDDSGQERERDGFIVKDVQLADAHVLSAVKRGDGTVVVVTIDGKRHEASA